MNSDNKLIHYEGDELFLEIALVGYRSRGESLVLSVCTEKDGALWCGVIDSYFPNKKSVRMTEDLIRRKGYDAKRPLDFVCVSHFHDDHIKGSAEILENYTDAHTSILTIKYSDERGVGKEVKKIRKIIHKKYEKRRVALENDRLFYNKTLNEGNLVWQFYGPQQVLVELKIEALMPRNSLVEHYDKNRMTGHNENDISVLLRILYSNKIFLFTGDCSDDALENISSKELYGKTYKESQTGVSYLKIPHHGSFYSENLVGRMEAGELFVDGAAACAYNESATSQKMMNRYKKVVKNLYYTRTIGEATAPYEYGVIKCLFDLNGNFVRGDCCKNAIKI